MCLSIQLFSCYPTREEGRCRLSVSVLSALCNCTLEGATERAIDSALQEEARQIDRSTIRFRLFYHLLPRAAIDGDGACRRHLRAPAQPPPPCLPRLPAMHRRESVQALPSSFVVVFTCSAQSLRWIAYMQGRRCCSTPRSSSAPPPPATEAAAAATPPPTPRSAPSSTP
jgi:hypothetical protein